MPSGMSRNDELRLELISTLQQALRDNAARGLLLHKTVADRFGLNPTDVKCLDLVRGTENVTAGAIAAVTGLSTSATTSVLDRLERAGFVERRRDGKDRRKVFIVSTGRHEAELRRAYGPLTEAFRRELEQYSMRDLRVILEFTVSTARITKEITNTLTGEQAREASG